MTEAWQDAPEPDHAEISPMGWVRVVWRGVPLGILVFACLIRSVTARGQSNERNEARASERGRGAAVAAENAWRLEP